MFYVIVGVSQSVIQVEDVAQGHLQGEPLAHRGPQQVGKDATDLCCFNYITTLLQLALYYFVASISLVLLCHFN